VAEKTLSSAGEPAVVADGVVRELMSRGMRQCLRRRRREDENATVLEERAAELAEERGGPVTRRRHRQDVDMAAAEEERAHIRNRSRIQHPAAKLDARRRVHCNDATRARPSSQEEEGAASH